MTRNHVAIDIRNWPFVIARYPHHFDDLDALLASLESGYEELIDRHEPCRWFHATDLSNVSLLRVSAVQRRAIAQTLAWLRRSARPPPRPSS